MLNDKIYCLQFYMPESSKTYNLVKVSRIRINPFTFSVPFNSIQFNSF